MANTGKLALSSSFLLRVLLCQRPSKITAWEYRKKCYLFITSTLWVCSWFWYLELLHNAALWAPVPGADWQHAVSLWAPCTWHAHEANKPQSRELDGARCKVCIHWSWIIVPQTLLIVKACFNFCFRPRKMEKTSFSSYIPLIWDEDTKYFFQVCLTTCFVSN